MAVTGGIGKRMPSAPLKVDDLIEEVLDKLKTAALAEYVEMEPPMAHIPAEGKFEIGGLGDFDKKDLLGFMMTIDLCSVDGFDNPTFRFSFTDLIDTWIEENDVGRTKGKLELDAKGKKTAKLMAREMVRLAALLEEASK